MLRRLRNITVIEVATILAFGFAAAFFVLDFYLMSSVLGFIFLMCLINVPTFEGRKSGFEIHLLVILAGIAFVGWSLQKLFTSSS